MRYIFDYIELNFTTKFCKKVNLTDQFETEREMDGKETLVQMGGEFPHWGGNCRKMQNS
jgi:hypothetical protein